MIFQDPYSSLDPRQNVGEIVGEPLEIHTDLSAKQREQRVVRAARSGRASARHVLRAVARTSSPAASASASRSPAPSPSNPRLLVCDEPVSALDVSTQSQVINLLKRPAGAAGAGLPLHRPRPLGGPPPKRPDRGHVPGPDRRGGGGRRGRTCARPTLHGRAAVGHPGARPEAEHTGRGSCCAGRSGRPATGRSGAASGNGARSPWRSARWWTREPYRTPAGTVVRCHLHTEGPALAGGPVTELATPSDRVRQRPADGAARSRS